MVASVENAMAGPSYVSARSADVILSDVRPIKLVPEALHIVNVLLDELLYTLLGTARALATERLKAALLKVVPTSLGKEALLEAEVELKAYYERTTPGAAGAADACANDGGFDLLWNFELLRLKCQAYSTMNDLDENTEAEARLRVRMEARGASRPPNAVEVAPAALYLTAIVESICEHILSNVSSVAARDSSRALATVQDVYIALCEDDTMYGTFRGMKVYDQIEGLTKAPRPRRSKSFSRTSDRVSSPTPTTSTHGGEAAGTGTGWPSARLRMSSESLKSAAAGLGSPERRTSSEKGRGIKKRLLSHSRSSSEKDVPETARAPSESGRSRASAEFEEDEDLLHEFDELMRSGGTMKVSLTPDRLKSMEVYNKERTQRANRRGTREADQISETAASDEPSQATSSSLATSPSSTHERQRTPSILGRPVLHHVDSINEDEEETSTSAPVPASTDSPSSPPPRTRQSSKSFSARSAPSTAVRNRSISISDMPHPRHEHASRSTGAHTQAPNGGSLPTRGPQYTATRQNSASMPARTRKVVRNRESIDLDEVMGASDDDEAEDEIEEMGMRPPPVPRTPRASNAQKPYISKSARELIAFLEEGPPEEIQTSRPSMANASVISFESSKSRSGRFSRMMSRLAIGGSTERLNGRSMDDPPKTPKTPRTLGRKPSTGSFAPPPSYRAPSLASKKSFPNVAISSPRAVQVPPSPKVLLPILSQPAPVSPSPPVPALSPTPLPRSLSATPSQASTEESNQPGASPRRVSMRKAVPPWDEKNEPRPPVPPLSLAGDSDGSAPSRNDSLRSLVDGAPAPQYREGSPADAQRERVRTLSIQTSALRGQNGRAKTPSPKGSDDERLATPQTPRRSPIPRKPPPSPTPPEREAQVVLVPAPAPASSSSPMASPSLRTPTSPSTPGPGPGAATTTSKSRSKHSSASTRRAGINTSTVADLRRLLGAATSADECRLLVDMFFARHGFPYGASAAPEDFPAPPPLDDRKLVSLSELECELVELFLGGGARSGGGEGVDVGVDAGVDVDVDRSLAGKQDTQVRAKAELETVAETEAEVEVEVKKRVDDDYAVTVPKRTRSVAQSATEETLVDEREAAAPAVAVEA